MQANTQNANEIVTEGQPAAEPSIMTDLLNGYRFRVCETAEDVERALEVRRAVYNGSCGYDVPVPDEHDSRSWILLAEDMRTGKAVGTMRITPRFGGKLELEEYFRLPLHLRSSRTVELNRFAILPEYRKGKTFLPAVSCGLFKLVMSFLQRLGTHHMVIASKPERIWTYEWLRFERTGVVASYGKLDDAKHELMAYDFRRALAILADHPFHEFFCDLEYPEIAVPANIPALDLVAEPEVPFRLAVGA